MCRSSFESFDASGDGPAPPCEATEHPRRCRTGQKHLGDAERGKKISAVPNGAKHLSDAERGQNISAMPTGPKHLGDADNCIGHNYTGRDYLGPHRKGGNHTGHGYAGRDHKGHDYAGHSYIAGRCPSKHGLHNYAGHNRIWPSASPARPHNIRERAAAGQRAPSTGAEHGRRARICV